ncbi:InlB B-repeat-containing protein [Natranaerofaba carboxydovora]|uniref:InlB B-repeat-containing protein n=1 Tax=Natranaerofaba carboxydovora TaxID=2742683 RepID=UPI001F145D9B|nr:hypothetical protein [Natranaerofaba carboxydovora]UMZ74072.1 hypothetical protein ACONDI_01645 [Natranaerofaba carboxydovora]
MSGKRLFHLLLITCLFVSVAFMTGCAPEEKAGDEQEEQDKDDSIEYEVEVQADPEEAGNITGEGTYKEGELAEIRAISENWYNFDNWTNKEGEVLEENKTLEIEVEDDKEIIANFKDEINVEESVKAEWPLEEVKQTAEEAFQIFNEDVSTTLFSEESLREVLESNSYPNFGVYQDYDRVGPGKLGFLGDVELQKIEESEESVQVTASLKYPKFSNENIEIIQKELINKLKSQAEEDSVSLRSLFIELLKDQDLEKEKTQKTIVLKETDDELKVTSMDSLEESYSSLDELYKESVIDLINEVVITTDDADTEVAYDESSINSVLARFNSNLEIELDQEKLTGVSTVIDPYLLDKTVLTLPSESKIPLNDILGPLEDKLDSSNPEANMRQIKFSDTLEQDKKNIRIVYQEKSEVNEVLGYLNSNKQDVNIIQDVNGVIDDYFWSPQEDYVAYIRKLWIGGETGSKTLNIYDTNQDEVFRVTDWDEFEEEYDELKKDTEQPEYNVNFQGLEWDEDGETLSFEVTPSENGQKVDSEDIEATTWEFSVKEHRLKKIK